MATRNSTATTPEELEAQFPMTNRPFAVWRYIDPDNSQNRVWAVNGMDGSTAEFQSINSAFKAAQNLAEEWVQKVQKFADDARKQAQALAEVMGAEADTDALTDGEKAAQFPINADPFAVWYCMDKSLLSNPWTINDEEGDAIASAANYTDAMKIACGFKAAAYVSAIKKAKALNPFLAESEAAHA